MVPRKYGFSALYSFFCVAAATWFGLTLMERSRVEIVEGIHANLDSMGSVCRRSYRNGDGYSKEEYGPWVYRQGFRSPLCLCGYSESTIDHIISQPHNCSRTSNRIWLDTSWVDAKQMLATMATQGPYKNNPVQCVIFCVEHLVPCPSGSCLVPFYLRRQTDDAQTAVDLLEGGDLDSMMSHTSFEAILDAGPGTGISTVLLATMYPRAQIVSLEPLKRRYEMLVLNTHSFRNVVPMRGALWTFPDVLHMWSSPDSHTEKNLRIDLPSKTPKDGKLIGTTQGIPVAMLLDLFNFPRFDIIKFEIDESRQRLLQEEGEDCTWLSSCKLIVVSSQLPHGKPNAFERYLVQVKGWRYIGRFNLYQLFLP